MWLIGWWGAVDWEVDTGFVEGGFADGVGGGCGWGGGGLERCAE